MASLDSIGGIHYEMMKRCYNEKSVAYKDYGAKGIIVCPEWHDRENFRKWALENGYEKGLRLERIDCKGNYEPTNCRFGTKYKDRGVNKGIQANILANKQKKAEAGIEGKIIEDELYVVYHGMHSRCERKSHPSYENYGGRGISVCEEWSGKDGFFNFKKWAVRSGWTKGLSLDRKENNKGYCPENCQWATRTQQNFHKRSNIHYEYCGISMPLGMIAKLEEVKYGLLYTRVRQKGMSVAEALRDIKKSTE